MSETPELAVACRRASLIALFLRSHGLSSSSLFLPLHYNVPVSSSLPPQSPPVRAVWPAPRRCVSSSRVCTRAWPQHWNRRSAFFLSRTPKFKAANDAMEDMATSLNEIEIDGGRVPGHGPDGQLNQAQCPMWCNSTDMTSVL